jgi:GNAT superfamily N-acetyltransferase
VTVDSASLHTVIREARVDDVPGMFRVRTSVTENLLSVDQLAERGITPESVAASFATSARGWVAEQDGRVVGFAVADLATVSIFALFVLPEHERTGLGSRLLELAVERLQVEGRGIWLTTARDSRALAFYQRRGWTIAAAEPDGSLRLELNPARQ